MRITATSDWWSRSVFSVQYISLTLIGCSIFKILIWSASPMKVRLSQLSISVRCNPNHIIRSGFWRNFLMMNERLFGLLKFQFPWICCGLCQEGKQVRKKRSFHGIWQSLWIVTFLYQSCINSVFKPPSLLVWDLRPVLNIPIESQTETKDRW